MVKYSEIEAAEQDIKDLRRLYLQQWGWKETSHTPGSHWLWQRDFSDVDANFKAWHDKHPTASPHRPYGMITAPTDLAVQMTVSCLDEQPELDVEDVA